MYNLSFAQIILYFSIFLALYTQVFFLLTFLANKNKLFKKDKLVPSIYPSISIIVACWNEEKSVEKTIASLLDIEYPKEKLFLYIVDDGSTDNTFNLAQKFTISNNQVKVIKKENGGKHTALNFALDQIDTELVASIDADTILEKNALIEVINLFQKRSDISAVGCTVLIGNPKTLIQKAQSIEYQMFSFSKKMLGILNGVLVAPGAFSVFKTKALKQVGGWTKGHSLEDLELTFRLHHNGFKSDHCHTAIAHTVSPESLRKLFKQRLRWGYGFLKNISDYRKLCFKKSLGNFGFFTIPTSIVAYLSIMFIFVYSWYRMSIFIYQKVLLFNTVGWHNFFKGSLSINWFFINTQAVSFLSILLFLSLIVSIFIGRRLSGVKKNPHHIIIYFLIYSVIQPFWVMRSVYNYFFAKDIAWR